MKYQVDSFDFMRQAEGTPVKPFALVARRQIQETLVIAMTGDIRGLPDSYFRDRKDAQKSREYSKKIQITNVIDCVLFVEDPIFDMWCAMAEVSPDLPRQKIYSLAASSIKKVITNVKGIPFPALEYIPVKMPIFSTTRVENRPEKFFNYNPHAMRNIIAIMTWLHESLPHTQFWFGVAWEIMRYELASRGVSVCYIKKYYRTWAVEYIRANVPALSQTFYFTEYSEKRKKA